MRISQQNGFAATFPQMLQERPGIVTKFGIFTDVGGHLVDVQIQPLAPVVKAIPVHGVLDGQIFVMNYLAGIFQRIARCRLNA
jgi:hypothetical protein